MYFFPFPQLQDLAVKPSLRDPQQNTAESVTEGHKPDIDATGQSDRIKAILWCSFFFSILSGPLLASYVIHYQKTRLEDQRESKRILLDILWGVLLDKQRECMTIDILCGVLLLIFLCLFIYCIVLAAKFGNFIPAIYPLIAILGCGVGGWIHCKFAIKINGVKVKWFTMPCFVTCANLTAYHFCWLLIGIMLNPTWGLAVLLVVILVIGVFTYMVFRFLSSDKKHPKQSFWSCLAALLAIYFLIFVVILAGQSYHGRETADELLKDAVMYLIPAFFTWLYLKHIASKNSPPHLI